MFDSFTAECLYQGCCFDISQPTQFNRNSLADIYIITNIITNGKKKSEVIRPSESHPRLR